MQKIEGLFKIFIRFSRKTHNHIGPNRRMGHQCFNTVNPVGIEFALVTATHQR